MSSDEFIIESDDDYEDFDPNLMPTEENKARHNMIIELRKLGTNTQQMLFNFQQQILKCKQFSIQEDLNIIIDLIREYILKIDQRMAAIGKIQGLEDVIEYSKGIQKDINEIKEKLKLWSLGEQKQYNQEHLLQIINNENIENNQDNPDNQDNRDNYSKCKVWKSKQLIISTFKIISNEILINKNNTLLFSSNYNNQIRIFGFQSSRKLIKQIRLKYGSIQKLLFTNKSEYLLSIGNNSEIFIWNKNWQPCQTLEDDSKKIKCIIANDPDDFITGGDKFINFWQKKNSSWSCSQTINIPATVTNFSLNLQQTKLISSGFSDENDHKFYHIYLFELMNEKWIRIQTFNTNQFYYDNVFFKENNSFVFINRYFGTIETFNYEQKTEQIIRTQLFQFQRKDKWNYNLCHYIRQTNTLVTNDCLYENPFIYFLNLGQNELQQRIDFQKGYNKVTVSKKGNYLIQYSLFDDYVQVLKLKDLD